MHEKKIHGDELSKLRQANAISDRAIKQGKLAMSKKEAANKELMEQRNKLHESVDDLNGKILDDLLQKDKQIRKRDDKNLTKKA